MAAVIYTEHFAQFFDNNGDPLSGGKLFAYSAGTTTPKPTFTTADGDVENAHPIILDSAGRATVFIEGSYRFDLFDSNDVLIDSTDDITSFSTLADAGDPFFESFSGDGSQTVFTLSESLGSDSKDIMVFVNDEANDVGYEIQNPSAYTLSGTSLTFSSAPPTGTNSIYVFAPTKLLGAASAAAGLAESAQTAAEAARDEAEAAAGVLDISSTTSLLIETGSKVFTVGSGLGLTAGQFVLADSDADGSNYMYGQITAYSGTSLTVNVTAIGGSGTFDDWTITLAGIQGVKGDTGSISDISGVSTATPTLTDTAIFTDVSDSNDTKKATIGDILDLAAGGLVPIQTQTVSSAVASVDFTTGIDGTYRTYIIEMENVLSSITNQIVYLRFSDDGGSSFISTGNYGYSRDNQERGSATYSGNAGNSLSEIPLLTPKNTTDFYSATLKFRGLGVSAKPLIRYNVENSASSGDGVDGWGFYQSTITADAIRIFLNSGNFTAGTFTLYGLAGA